MWSFRSGSANCRSKPQAPAALAAAVALLLASAGAAPAQDCAELAAEGGALQSKIAGTLNSNSAGETVAVDGSGDLMLARVDDVAITDCEVTATTKLMLQNSGQADLDGTVDVTARVTLLTPAEVCLEWYKVSAVTGGDILARAAAVATAERTLLPNGCIDRVVMMQKTTPPGAGPGAAAGRGTN